MSPELITLIACLVGTAVGLTAGYFLVTSQWFGRLTDWIMFH